MRTSISRRPVSCQLNLADGVADIESFRAGAREASWVENEITITVIQAVYKSQHFDQVGEVLAQYCTDESLSCRTHGS
jgi:hypothetical protein